MISRNNMREIILQIMYTIVMRPTQDIEDVKNDLYNKYELTEENKKNINTYVNGIISMADEIDNIIKSVANKQDIDVISTVDKCILSIALFEIKNAHDLDIPNAVSVHEAVNLSKKFAKDNSPSFVNAVLRNYLNNINGK